jgi:uncharacterized protein (DUF2235 family)
MKRLIACTDGTWDKPGDTKDGESYDSNVCLLYNAIKDVAEDGTKQLKAYDTGVGSSFGWRDRLLGGTMGTGLDRKIMEMYSFLMLNYQPAKPPDKSDEIYLFGFSRGAYTARSLVGFIRCCGILKPENLHLLETAFGLYRDRNKYTSPDSDAMVAFRRNFSIEDITHIHLLGVWDTVGSLGLPLSVFKLYNSEKYQFHDVTLSSTVKHAFHALAIDERRKLFEPTLWEPSTKVVTGEVKQISEQRWFPGVHCNIGGGYEDRGLSNGSLHWMAEKANGAGLEFNNHKLGHFHKEPTARLRNSYTLPFWFWHKIWREVKGRKHLDQQFDESVDTRLKELKSYRPQNLAKIDEFEKYFKHT